MRREGEEMARKKAAGGKKQASPGDAAPFVPGPDDVVVRVSDSMARRLREILAMTDCFCKERLDEEFAVLCQDMAATLCVQGFPLESGKAAGWAAGIVYSVGWVNFLNDPSQPHHMKM